MLDVNKEYTISEVAEITGYAPHVLGIMRRNLILKSQETTQTIGIIPIRKLSCYYILKAFKKRGLATNK